MKKSTLFILSGLLTVAVFAVLGVCFWGDIASWLSPEAFAGGSFTIANFVGAAAAETTQGTQQTTVAGSQTDNFKKPEHNRPTISQKLTKIMPSATPLDTILRELDSVSTNSTEYKYYSVNTRGVMQKVKTATAAGNPGGVMVIPMNSTHIFSVDGNILVPAFNGSGYDKQATAAANGMSFTPLVLHIVAIDRAAETLTVFPINADRVPALPANTDFFRMGVAKNELAAITEDPASLPTSDSNFCQIHMTTVSEGVYQAMQDKEIKYGLLDIKEQALFDFRMTNEADSLFGVKREIVDPISQKTKYLSDGMIRKIRKHLDKGGASAVTEDVMIGWSADIFSGNNGSDERIMFYGSGFGVDIARARTVQKQLEAGKTEVKFGITFNRVETVHGVLLLKLHNLLDLYGYGDCGMVVDPANIYRSIQKPLEATPLELDKAGQSRSKTVRIDESHTLAVTNPDTHAMLYSK